MIKKIASPYQLAIRYGNDYKGPNGLWSFLPKSLSEFFEEITMTDELLKTAYIIERYRAEDAPLNRFYPKMYPSNRVSVFDGTEFRIDKELDARISHLLNNKYDEAEIYLLNDLLKRTDKIFDILKPTSLGSLPPSLGSSRLLFVQGGIGSGKTTLLNHFSRVLVAELSKENEIPYEFMIPIINCDPIAANLDINKLWPQLLKDIRTKLAEMSKLDNEAGWKRIAHDDIYLPDGSFRPEISTFPSGKDTKIKRIVYESEKDIIFIKRVCREYWKYEKKNIVVVVLDNLDRREIPWSRQISVCNHLISLLDDCRYMLGILPVREYTLGNLSHYDVPARFGFLDRMHITTPIIGKAIQKRLSLYVIQIRDKIKLLDKKILISDHVSIEVNNYLDMVLGMIDCLAEAIEGNNKAAKRLKSKEDELLLKKFSPGVFFNGSTNSDLRVSLQMCLSALRSWALLKESILITYLSERDIAGKGNLPLLSLDEIIRLVSIGEWMYFEELKGSGIINVFNMPGEMPNAELGRCPNLIRYRFLEYLSRFGEVSIESPIKIDILRRHLQIFGYTFPNIDRLIDSFIKLHFIESPEGTQIKNIKNLLKTRKATYYHKFLCKLIVYLENIRNDAMIDYKSRPHVCREEITNDLYEILNFIEFIYEKEKEELIYMKRNINYLNIYKQRFLGGQPICWRLLRSVVRRVNVLYNLKPSEFPKTESKELKIMFANLCDKIMEASRKGEILPSIPVEYKMFPLKITWKRI